MTDKELSPITAFRGEHFFLSNFYPCEIRMDGKVYPTLEHAYQAAKTTDPEIREAVRCAATPGKAKRIGRSIEHIRENWNVLRVEAMRHLLARKFSSGSELALALLATNPRKLVEDNTWGDKFWGVHNGTGLNYLGLLLMERREELAAHTDENVEWERRRL